MSSCNAQSRVKKFFCLADDDSNGRIEDWPGPNKSGGKERSAQRETLKLGVTGVEGERMSSPTDASMEEIPLEDEDQDSMEYKVVLAFAQRRLSASKYGQLLEKGVKTQRGLSQDEGEMESVPQAHKTKRSHKVSIKDKKPTALNKKQRTKTSTWKCRLLPSCLRRETEEGPQQPSANQDDMNGLTLHAETAGGSADASLGPEARAETISHVADRLVKIVRSKSPSDSSGVAFRTLVRTPSLEEDGNDTEKDEEKIIEAIVDLLRKSGDELVTKLEQDRTFHQYVMDMFSYAFFKKVTDQFLEDIPMDSIKEDEDKIQYTKVAFTLEVATRLTAVDNHPMNLVLGFGSKYLKEHFSPWIQNHGGWEKALELLDEEEVE
ncbi:apoptosis facilitator Bcl-2-like protein 14 isoform X1 [Alligator mississippiensis]|uniref:apoptosis facilitator Bcl-2-like protein 14 isoform X1 n=2 Tax=Alligator mississippiensis TaxID=8496 RepID=UPI002877644C|nr:apoptosis facilitator Bcl-2-like protein 14 isoform X1 [Alligator mississippiensis]